MERDAGPRVWVVRLVVRVVDLFVQPGHGVHKAVRKVKVKVGPKEHEQARGAEPSPRGAGSGYPRVHGHAAQPDGVPSVYRGRVRERAELFALHEFGVGASGVDFSAAGQRAAAAALALREQVVGRRE